jgi:hypothetical protein
MGEEAEYIKAARRSCLKTAAGNTDNDLLINPATRYAGLIIALPR